MITLKFTGFRAVNDPDLAKRIHDEHRRRLAEFNISALTSSTCAWLTNPNVYCICTIDEDRDEILGSIRIHFADRMCSLPVEDALMQFGEDIRPIINYLIQKGLVVESCGLWCSGKTLAKRIGLSAKLLAFETAVCKNLNVAYCFGLVPNHNLALTQKAGFKKHEWFQSPFLYPSDKYQSWLVYKKPLDLKESMEEAKLKILINDPHLVYRSTIENETIIIKYECLH